MNERKAIIKSMRESGRYSYLERLSRLTCFDKAHYPLEGGMEAAIQINDYEPTFLPRFISDVFYHGTQLINDPTYPLAPKQSGEINDRDAQLATEAIVDLSKLLSLTLDGNIPVTVRLSFKPINSHSDVFFTESFNDARVLVTLITDTLLQIERSAKEKALTLTPAQKLMLKSGISTSRIISLGALIPSVPKQTAEVNSELPYYCNAKFIPYEHVANLTQEQLTQWLSKNQWRSLIDYASEGVLSLVSAKLAPVVSDISDKAALNIMLTIFREQREALMKKNQKTAVETDYLYHAIRPLERLIALANGGESLEAFFEVAAMPSDHPIIIQAMVEIEQRDPSQFFDGLGTAMPEAVA